MNDLTPPANEPGLDPDLRDALDRQLALPRAQEDALIARVKERVMGAIGSRAKPPHHTVRASDEGWQTIAPGVECKWLWITSAEQSCMMRLARGASVAAHEHLLDEECVVLEGTLRIGDLVLKSGDFHVARKGSRHETVTTDTGALVYLRGALAAA